LSQLLVTLTRVTLGLPAHKHAHPEPRPSLSLSADATVAGDAWVQVGCLTQ
jgi:hypothetical protein